MAHVPDGKRLAESDLGPIEEHGELAAMGRANWTQGQSDWGYGVLDGVPYITIGRWGSNSIRSADFDTALERFRSAPAIILDVRMNPGGNDSLAFEIAGRFARSSVVFGSVRFRNGPSHGDFGQRPRARSTLAVRGSTPVKYCC